MAFSSSIVQINELGGGLRIITGTWSGVANDAAGTVRVPGGSTCMAKFTSVDASGQMSPVGVTESVSNTVITLTVNNAAAVTDGRFVIITRS
jgi:hypothetical protein